MLQLQAEAMQVELPAQLVELVALVELPAFIWRNGLSLTK